MSLVIELSRRLKHEGLEVTAESYRDDLLGLAHADPADAYGDDGKLLPLSRWPAELRRSIKSMKLGPLGNIESVTWEGRAQVMGLLGKHRLVGAFDEKRRETRVYIIRDYTGQRKELPATVEPDAIEAELVASSPDQVDQADKPDDIQSLEGVLIAPGDIDRGSIPVRGQPGRPADAEPA